MTKRESGRIRERVPLSALERTYAAFAPVIFRTAHEFERWRGASPDELRSRHGYINIPASRTFWFHGASAGEMAAASGLAAALSSRGFDFNPIYTAANRAGVEWIRNESTEAKSVGLAPWDTSACVGRVLDRSQPQALFLVETELWPRMVFESYRRGIPVFSVSARIFPPDLRRYKAIKPFIERTLRRITMILTQDEVERQRFLEIGAPCDRCVSAGNLKYVRSLEDGHNRDMGEEVALERRDKIVVFGSVHRDEIPMMMPAIERLIGDRVRVVVAPRQLSSADVIMREANRRGWNSWRRSGGRPMPDWRLLVLDSMGELRRFYTNAACAVVGGGFGNHGGHNPFEPIIAGAPCIFGARSDNFASEIRALAAVTPQASMSRADDLGHLLASWLEDEAERQRILELQRSAVPDGDAIAARYTQLLEPWLRLEGGA